MGSILSFLARLCRSRLPIPAWQSERRFKLDRLRFQYLPQADRKAPPGRIGIMKPRALVDCYVALFAEIRPKLAVEFGFRHAGSSIFFARLGRLRRLVGFDLRQHSPAVLDLLRRHGENARIALHFGVPQDDAAKIRAVIGQEFGGEPLDLIVDDASHFYAQSRATFEARFGYLRPAGAYVIEDWGWANWAGTWQEPDGRWQDRSALTNLVFELVMVAASRPDIVTQVRVVHPAMVIVIRGPGLAHGQAIDLDACYQARGRSLTLI